MSKYRFKTEEEFKRDGLWNKNQPFKWVKDMLKYLGTDIPDKLTIRCDKQENFRHESWHFEPHDYVLKEIQSEYNVGKWYGYKNWSSPYDFIKLERVYDDQAYFTEYLIDGDYRKEKQNWWSFVSSSLFEADMSIVSPLLPDRHPDKITAEESPKEIDMKDIQEEAKKRFPIGCEFIPVSSDNTYTLIEDSCTYEIHGKYIWGHDGHGSLYEDGKWATLVSLPETKKERFHKGDYIVTLVDDGNCGKVNYCSKQAKDSDYLTPEIDIKGSRTNGNSFFHIKDTSNTKWRYATQEEASEYERIGKPYDVTTLQKKEKSIPEYVECIKSGTKDFTVGKIYNWPEPVDDNGRKRGIHTLNGSLWEFKPYYEDQNAPKTFKSEYIPQVGDYVVMERAGGWGYNPKNNGCIAIVEEVSTKEVGFGSNAITVPSIGGQIINAKKLGDVTFTNVPIIGYEKQLVFRKALPHEIPNGLPKTTVVTEWPSDPIVEQRINTPSIKKETFIDNVQSVDVVLRTKKKSIKF